MLRKLRKTIRSVFVAFIKTGVTDNNITEHNRQVIMTNLFGLVGQSITFVLGMVALYNSRLILGFCLLASSIVFTAGYFIVRMGGSRIIASSCILYNLMFLMGYLVYSGGVDNTGPLWLYLVPSVTLFFSGLRKGISEILIFAGLISIMMFYKDGILLATHYDHSFKLRLLYSFLTVTFLSGYYEYSRTILFDHMVLMQEKFERQAKQDPLTGLLNRRGIMQMLTHEYNRLERHEEPLSIILCDVDFFKSVNDTYGHSDGDTALKQLAGLFHQSIRKQDMVARWGGEEFLFLLPGANVTDASRVAEKIRKQVENSPVRLSDNSVNLTISLGVAEVSRKNSLDYAITKADEHLYQAKSGGRNQVVPGFPQVVPQTGGSLL